jgi:molecular chaperone DnaK
LDSSAETADLNAAFDELTKASHRLAEIMYQKTAGQGAPHGAADGQADPSAAGGKQEAGKKEDDVIDAEYVDMDKNE